MKSDAQRCKHSAILIIDHEGFTPLDIRQNPSLIDLERARCQNKFLELLNNGTAHDVEGNHHEITTTWE
ncbi:hypothetical protein ANCDUO_14124 [Ancylostoma duodenale]|uniref:Uncharacterized protein n=1 Tax=Ancylostoma duodenale TaxID=51022 RepID=A0A0C2G9Y4_9BILA|nr:hypothetical protein ANCDUO_14124 [Ancylostoma duodenale]